MATHVLVTGGPTRAYLDEIRYLSNLSTGELAFRICQNLAKRKFRVHAVVGRTSFPFESIHGVKVYAVETNEEMRSQVMRVCKKYGPGFGIFSAAVLDFVPRKKLKGKTSSKKKSWKVELVPGPKIVDEVGRRFPKMKRIGFKLEVSKPRDFESLGKKILNEKKYWALVMNFLGEVSSKKHLASLLTKDGIQRFSSKEKIAIALTGLITKESARK